MLLGAPVAAGGAAVGARSSGSSTEGCCELGCELKAPADEAFGAAVEFAACCDAAETECGAAAASL